MLWWVYPSRGCPHPPLIIVVLILILVTLLSRPLSAFCAFAASPRPSFPSTPSPALLDALLPCNCFPPPSRPPPPPAPPARARPPFSVILVSRSSSLPSARLPPLPSGMLVPPSSSPSSMRFRSLRSHSSSARVSTPQCPARAADNVKQQIPLQWGRRPSHHRNRHVAPCLTRCLNPAG